MLPPRSSFEVDYRLRQRLLTEGSEARLFGAARFSDGPTQLSNPDPTPHPNPTPILTLTLSSTRWDPATGNAETFAAMVNKEPNPNPKYPYPYPYPYP